MESEKGKIRKLIQRKRDLLTSAERQEKSREIQKNLFGLPEFNKAGMVLFYAPKGNEVDTCPMIDDAIRAGKRVALPITDLSSRKLILSEIKSYQKEICTGTYGIPEPGKEFFRPVMPEKIDIVIVPGIAFDKSGYRVGYGGGFYDRFLKTTKALRVGLAFQLQIVEEKLPSGPLDLPVDLVMTEDTMYDIRRRRQ